MKRIRPVTLVPFVVAAAAACVADAPAAHFAIAAEPTAAESVPLSAATSLIKRVAPRRLNVTVTFEGADPLYPGMSLARAVILMEGDLWQLDKSLTCSYFRSARVPGMKFLFLDRRLARLEVDSGTIATPEGVKIGSTEAEVHAAYPGRVTVIDDTFAEGHHFLSVAAPEGADTTFRIVFETDGMRVMRYRTGIRHVVEWAEGCS